MTKRNPTVSAETPSADENSVPSPAESVDAIAKARDLDELERIRRSVMAVGEATYHWDIASDKIVWSANVPDVLQTSDDTLVATGRGYADLLDPDNFTSRYDAIMRSTSKDQGEGVPFSIEYLLNTERGQIRQAVWVEDCGRWYAGRDGQPSEAFGVVRQIDDRHERDQQLEYMGNCDPLTGMMNRGKLSEALAATMARATQEDTSCAFLIAVINNLAVVNDAYGFDIADEVIVSVGQRLNRIVRTGDMIGRYSGAKFGIILSDCSEEEIRGAAERFLNIARDSVFETERGPVWAMMSIGGVVLPKFAADTNAAMAYAEEALAEAKRQSSDSFVPYRPSAERISVRSLNARCASEIVSSLKEDRFALAYQPIVDAKTGRIAFQEALLRMRCDDGDTVAAHHLIPIAEKLGLVRLIDRAVARMTVDALARAPNLSVSINVSGTTATDPRWFNQLTSILSEEPGIADRVMLEITETVALQDLDQTIRFTRALREMGCRVAIDDFGAGYTSFRNLRELDIDMVKIDGTFCERLSENEDNQYFVRSLVDLAKKFDLLTAAEWVESEADAELLRSWGVDYLQGNLFGEPTTDVPWAQTSSHGHRQTPDEAAVFDASMISIALQQEDEQAKEPDRPVVAMETEDMPFQVKVPPTDTNDDAHPMDDRDNEPADHPNDDNEAMLFVNSGKAKEPAGTQADAPKIKLPTAEDLTLEPFQAMRPHDMPTGPADDRYSKDDAPDTSAAAMEKPAAGGEFAPIKLELDQSLLKSAMSELDATFGPRSTTSSESDHPDLAGAIAKTFAADQKAGS
ncbi:MAG: EAL domain-containing protein [Rhizobiales bacterium]|nr:EAL domain-containing protein [Hyphomicrobiales bacterium]